MAKAQGQQGLVQRRETKPLNDNIPFANRESFGYLHAADTTDVIGEQWSGEGDVTGGTRQAAKRAAGQDTSVGVMCG